MCAFFQFFFSLFIFHNEYDLLCSSQKVFEFCIVEEEKEKEKNRIETRPVYHMEYEISKLKLLNDWISYIVLLSIICVYLRYTLVFLLLHSLFIVFFIKIFNATNRKWLNVVEHEQLSMAFIVLYLILPRLLLFVHETYNFLFSTQYLLRTIHFCSNFSYSHMFVDLLCKANRKKKIEKRALKSDAFTICHLLLIAYVIFYLPTHTYKRICLAAASNVWLQLHNIVSRITDCIRNSKRKRKKENVKHFRFDIL